MRLLLLAATLAACRGGAAAPPDADERDRFRQPERIVAALALHPGSRVADLGAGTGYLTVRLADAVGATGRVVATDVDDAPLAVLRARTAGRPEIVVRKVAPDDPGLEAGAFDAVLMSQLDQYVPDRATYLARVRAALAPGGRLVVVNRRPFRKPLLDAAAGGGWRVVSEITDLPVEYLVVLEPAL